MKDKDANKILKKSMSIEFVNVYLKFKISRSIVEFLSHF